MANKYCTVCGAPLPPDAVICPNCGRLVSSDGKRGGSGGARTAKPKARTAQTNKKTAVKTKTKSRSRMAEPEYAEPVERQNKSSGKATRLIFRLLTVAVVVAAAYIAVFAIQVFRVKVSKYDFESDLKLSAKNYGQAIEGYFESGEWSVNPFNGTCTYKGETKHSEEYEIVFTARLKVDVDKILVDGEEIDEKQIETRMMGMFI